MTGEVSIDLDLISWLELAVRWFHLIAGIAWIGSSFYFIWLDNSLKPPTPAKPGVGGELWAVHGGGFYHKQKYVVAPSELPADLHWFKWEAYSTWISGFFLLILIYYLGAEIYLVDPGKAPLSAWQAIVISLAFLTGGWLAYDLLCRSPIGKNQTVFGFLLFGILTAAAYALNLIFGDRGAVIHVGALIGTMMVANVAMVIIPNQRKAVAAMIAGQTPDPALGKIAKQRSLHNNYLVLPVLFIMISNHYPQVTGSDYNWLLLAGLGAVGWAFRHFFNLKHRGTVRYWLPAAGTAGFLAVAIVASVRWTAPPSSADAVTPQGGDTVSIVEVRGLMQMHCTQCHAASPTHESFATAPAGILLETDTDIVRYADLIREQVVDSDLMPLGNLTEMTDAERARLGAWIEAGAKASLAD